MPATKESEAEFEARMLSDLNRILAEQKALHLQARGLPPPAWAVDMQTQAFQEQTEIYRQSEKRMGRRTFLHPLAHPKIIQSPAPIHGQEMAQILPRNPPFEQEIHSA